MADGDPIDHDGSASGDDFACCFVAATQHHESADEGRQGDNDQANAKLMRRVVA